MGSCQRQVAFFIFSFTEYSFLLFCRKINDLVVNTISPDILTCFVYPMHTFIFQKALEILESNAYYKNSEYESSRALAFRRCSCVLKSLPFTVTKIKQVKGLTDVGKHNLHVIQVRSSLQAVNGVLLFLLFPTFESFFLLFVLLLTKNSYFFLLLRHFSYFFSNIL